MQGGWRSMAETLRFFPETLDLLDGLLGALESLTLAPAAPPGLTRRQ
jgi:hypothetical protein